MRIVDHAALERRKLNTGCGITATVAVVSPERVAGSSGVCQLIVTEVLHSSALNVAHCRGSKAVSIRHFHGTAFWKREHNKAVTIALQ
jgi:hypothetical protein